MQDNVEKNEQHIWDRYFAEALSDKGQEMENKDLWWRISEDDTIDILFEIFGKKSISILEAGCGSGGTNFSAAEKLNIRQITLLDISQNALRYAKKITPSSLAGITKYVKGSVFQLKASPKYDLVWNTGLIEHYNKKQIVDIVSNMLTCLHHKGAVVIGMPNRKCPAILKAALLGTSFAKKYLPFIKGYRNTTETLYSNHEIKQLLEKNFKGYKIQVKYAGSPTFVGTHTFLVKIMNRFFNKSSFSFLTYFILTERKHHDSKTHRS